MDICIVLDEVSVKSSLLRNKEITILGISSLESLKQDTKYTLFDTKKVVLTKSVIGKNFTR